MKQQMNDQLEQVRKQLEAIVAGAAVTPPKTFAEVARSSPSPQQSIALSLSPGNTAEPTANEFFCMIDTSRVEEQDRGRAQIGSIRQAIENEVRTKEGQVNWKDEIELQRIKEAAQKTAVTGARVMRDQLYPVKVDNVNRTAILDGEGNILQGAAEALGVENNVSIGKITWLSNKETSKAYGSMVVYVTKKNDAKKLLDGKYFDLAGESACTNPFEPRKGPMQCFNCQDMGHKAFRCSKPQLNVRKREPVQQSLMNDEDLKDYGVLAVSEPYARMIDGKVVTSPRMHSNWTRILPTHMSDGPWPIRSMLWVRDDVEVMQMPIPSADLTAAVLRLPERSVLVVSVYVEGQSTEALKSTTGLLHDLIQRFRQGSGARTDVVLAGDFNSHDLLWGGDDVSVQRQGEAGLIIDLMNEHGLRSLLPRGTKTWQRKDQESTIDLVLTTSELADEVATCTIHPTDHGSDHRAIQTTFDITMPEEGRGQDSCLRMPWNLIRARTDQLMRIVLEAIHELTPRARPSPYAKPRTQRRGGQPRPELERRAKEAAKEFHDAIRYQRKTHWDDFLSDDANIWKATKYLKAGKSTTGDKVPPLRKGDGSTTEDKADQADELLIAFFPP
ncbi:endonuclease-reverse transcriptase domain-containing protein [Hirsutella rhossiliensis]